jgi:hypothetical protein
MLIHHKNIFNKSSYDIFDGKNVAVSVRMNEYLIKYLYINAESRFIIRIFSIRDTWKKCGSFRMNEYLNMFLIISELDVRMNIYLNIFMYENKKTFMNIFF